jgi:hypothetical protein
MSAPGEKPQEADMVKEVRNFSFPVDAVCFFCDFLNLSGRHSNVFSLDLLLIRPKKSPPIRQVKSPLSSMRNKVRERNNGIYD